MSAVKKKPRKPAKKSAASRAKAKPQRPPKSTAYTTGGIKGKGNPFARGNPGKPKGRLSLMKYRVKEALLEAAERSGQDGKGRDGMIGYFVWLSRNEPRVFGRMLEKVMPTQVELKDRRSQLTPAEAADRLRSRGIPVPPLLLEMSAISSVTREREQVINAEDDLADDKDEASRRGLHVVDDDKSDWDDDEEDEQVEDNDAAE